MKKKPAKKSYHSKEFDKVLKKIYRFQIDNLKKYSAHFKATKSRTGRETISMTIFVNGKNPYAR